MGSSGSTGGPRRPDHLPLEVSLGLRGKRHLNRTRKRMIERKKEKTCLRTLPFDLMLVLLSGRSFANNFVSDFRCFRKIIVTYTANYCLRFCTFCVCFLFFGKKRYILNRLAAFYGYREIIFPFSMVLLKLPKLRFAFSFFAYRTIFQ